MMLWHAAHKDNKSLHGVYYCGHKCLNTFSQSDDSPSPLSLNDLKYVTREELYCNHGICNYNTLYKQSEENNFNLREASDYYITESYFNYLEDDEL